MGTKKYIWSDCISSCDLTNGKRYFVHSESADQYQIQMNDGHLRWVSKEQTNFTVNGVWHVEVVDDERQDMVNQPSHYQLLNGLEVKDVRKAIFEKIPMGKLSYHQSDCYSRAWEYLTRCCFKHESPLEDLQKAQTYLNWLVDDLSKQKQP